MPVTIDPDTTQQLRDAIDSIELDDEVVGFDGTAPTSYPDLGGGSGGGGGGGMGDLV